MASVQNIGINVEKNKVKNERTQQSSEMAKEISSAALSKSQTRESSYWFAHSGHENVLPSGTSPNDPKAGGDTKEQQQKEKDEKIRRLRNLELQEEERLRKVRELELQFSQSRKHREQQEEERRRKIEEAKVKEAERRLQVEERKRQIWEAEQERKEAILRRNMEREARIEARRNAQRNSQCFAFGSSTPRSFDLDLAAIGVRNQGSVLMCSVSRKSEERELGPPPRATSACSLDRKFGEDCMSRSMVSLSSSAFRGRRRTDITPTPTPRERSTTPHSGSHARGKDSSRSPSRPHSSLSGTSDISATSSSMSAVQMRSRPAPRKPRPFSVAGSIVDSATAMQSVRREQDRQTRVQDRNVSAPATKPQRAKSANRESGEFRNTTKPLIAPKKPVLPPKPTELLAKSNPVPVKDNLRKVSKPASKPSTGGEKPATDASPKPNVTQNGVKSNEEVQAEGKQISPTSTPNPSPPIQSPQSDSDKLPTSPESTADALSQLTLEPQPETEIAEENIPIVVLPKEASPRNNSVVENGVAQSSGKKEELPSSMTGSFTMENGGTPKPRINSEEEARAALAEKRRLAREQAEREAEMERLRLEEIRRQEEEQRRLEEQEQRRMEEEQIRLAELHRQLEQEKLNKAIEEQQQREREEQEKREEEARQKAEREEQEKKAREEAEKQRVELEEKLKKEEEERAERKRRVEQIMARTRGKSAAQSPVTPTQPSEKSTPTTPAEPPSTPSQDPTKPYSNGVKNHNGTSKNYVTNSWPFSSQDSGNPSLPDLLNSAHVNGSGGVSANEDVSPQTNGYSSHEEMSCTTSPEESSEMGLLIDIQSCQQRSSKVLSESVDFTKLVEVDPPSLDNGVNNENYLISVGDNVNSNLFNNANPFLGFEDTMQQKQDATSVTDLLS